MIPRRRAEMKKKGKKNNTGINKSGLRNSQAARESCSYAEPKGEIKGGVHFKFPSQQKHLENKLNLSPGEEVQRWDEEVVLSAPPVATALHEACSALYLVLTSHLLSIHHPFISCQHVRCSQVENNIKNNTTFPSDIAGSDWVYPLSFYSANAYNSRYVRQRKAFDFKIGCKCPDVKTIEVLQRYNLL